MRLPLGTLNSNYRVHTEGRCVYKGTDMSVVAGCPSLSNKFPLSYSPNKGVLWPSGLFIKYLLFVMKVGSLAQLWHPASLLLRLHRDPSPCPLAGNHALIGLILSASEIAANLHCNCVHLYWEGCVILYIWLDDFTSSKTIL